MYLKAIGRQTEMSLITKCKRIDGEMLKAIQDTQSKEYLLASSPRVTTMTILLPLNSGIRSFENVAVYFEKNGGCKWLNDTFGGEWTFKLYAGFYNCGIVRCKIPKGDTGLFRTISIKIFRNGKLHMTGFQSLEGALTYGNKIVQTLSEHFELSDISKTRFEIVDAEVHLVNVCFHLDLGTGCILCLKELNEVLQGLGREDVTSMFNSDHHPGVRIKMGFGDKKVTVMVFKSGSVLLNALLDGTHITQSFNFIIDVFESNKNKLITGAGECKKRKRTSFDYSVYVN